MTIKKEFGKLPKEVLYNMYVSIVYDYKMYDNITRTKMINEIISEYDQENYLYHICTGRELEFLKKFSNNQINEKNIGEYTWEITQLNEKFIFSTIDFDIFLEQKQNVNKALEIYKKHFDDKERQDSVITFMIGMVRMNGEMLLDVLLSLIKDVSSLDEKNLNAHLGHPLFHFYCEIFNEDIGENNNFQETVIYRKYFNFIDLLREARKEYGTAGSLELNPKNIFDMFYFGLPLSNNNVRKMYDVILKEDEAFLLLQEIDICRLLNDREFLSIVIKDEKLLEIINKGLDDTPCAAMNGFTPNQYKSEKLKECELSNKFSSVPQNNAHLCKRAADEYYKIYFALLEYTNNKYKINKNIKKIYKQEGIDANELVSIDKYLWENKKIIDEFIDDNMYKFNKEELDIVNGFKGAVTSKMFTVVGYDREYTRILCENGKIYMVKGIRDDLDKIIPSKDLPIIISTTLLMFKDKIIYNSFLSTYELQFGNDYKEMILREYDNAIEYYHL